MEVAQQFEKKKYNFNNKLFVYTFLFISFADLSRILDFGVVTNIKKNVTGKR